MKNEGTAHDVTPRCASLKCAAATADFLLFSRARIVRVAAAKPTNLFQLSRFSQSSWNSRALPSSTLQSHEQVITTQTMRGRHIPRLLAEPPPGRQTEADQQTLAAVQGRLPQLQLHVLLLSLQGARLHPLLLDHGAVTW